MPDRSIPGSFGAFARLLRTLSLTDADRQRRTSIQEWMKDAPGPDAFRAIRLFAGDLPSKLMSRKALAALHDARSPLPEWLREECHAAAPDPCEAIALLEDAADRPPCAIGLDAICEDLRKVARSDAAQKASFVVGHWDALDQESLYQFNRLVAGTFSMDLPRGTWVSAIAGSFTIPAPLLSHRLAQPQWIENGIDALADPHQDRHVLPLPFPEITTIREAPEVGPGKWSMQWHRPGLEVQLVKRAGSVTLWNRDFEVLQDRTELLLRSAEHLPDGTILYCMIAIPDQLSGPAGSRSKKNSPPFDAILVIDVWEWEGRAPDQEDPAQRMALLSASIASIPDLPFRMQDPLPVEDAAELKALHRRSRLEAATGLLLLPFGTIGAGQNALVCWTAAPHRIKAVLLYAQRADGLQGPQYSFALAQGRDWVTVARTGEGLNDQDQEDLERFIKANTLQRFGPVRTVKAVQVMDLAVDRIRASTRHKSGYLLEGVRITAWRKDLGTEMADDISILNSMKE